MSASLLLKGQFEAMAGVRQAVQSLHSAGFADYEVYSPVITSEDLEEHMPRRGSWVRPISAVGGVSGVFLGFAMCIVSAGLYMLVVGGKAPKAFVPYVVVGFECTILFACLATVAGLVGLARLKPMAPPAEYDPRFSSDRYGVYIQVEPARRQEAEGILRQAGAVEVLEGSAANG